MPGLACWSCGRQIYTTAPLASLFAEERRCPRCGAALHDERRTADRRESHRRTNPEHDPGPPAPADNDNDTGRDKSKGKGDDERRAADRRTTRRRGGGRPPPPAAADDQSGWRD
jgi:hypothetical protein